LKKQLVGLSPRFLEGQIDLLQVVLVVPGDFVELILERPHAGFSVDELQAAASLVMQTNFLTGQSPKAQVGRLVSSDSGI